MSVPTTKEKFSDNSFVRYWDESAKAPYLWSDENRVFISYEDEESIKYKVDYIKSLGLSGMMFWEYTDDYEGRLIEGLK